MVDVIYHLVLKIARNSRQGHRLEVYWCNVIESYNRLDNV